MTGSSDRVYAEIELKETDAERKKKGLFVKHTLCAW